MTDNSSNTDDKKGNHVELATFLKYPDCNLLGHRTLEKDGKKFVTFIWCKVCAKYKNQLSLTLKGSAKKSALAFIEGTSSVTKHQVS